MRPAFQNARGVLAAVLVVALAACQSAYYGAMEKAGFHKRDILTSRVKSAMESQEEAKAEFENAYERFATVVSVAPSELSRTYRALNTAYERAEGKAKTVRNRIDAVESVSGALFKEWRDELELIGDRNLRADSERQLRRSQSEYDELITSMRRAEARMDPVLGTFRDYVLYLKHNLNAQAIASLRGELAGVEADVSELVREMEASIAKARSFIQTME
jgi:hypothetical protein